MEEKEKKRPQEIIIEFIKNNPLFVGLILLGLIFVVIGIFQYLSSKNSQPDIRFSSDTKPGHTSADVKGLSDSQKKISVDVEGKVVNPGVYSLSENARIQDALIAAGGMSSGADRVYVSKHLNLAQKVVDGGKIYILGISENTAADTTAPLDSSLNTTQGTNNVLGDSSGMININSATAAQLDTLPKVGPVTAQKIITARPYTSVDELVSKKVVTQKTLDGFKDKIVAE